MPENKLYNSLKKQEQKPQTSEWDDDPLELELQQANWEHQKTLPKPSAEERAAMRKAFLASRKKT